MEIDFMSAIHKSVKRDYLARVNDPDYPKALATKLARKWDFDYWDGDRKINYNGQIFRGKMGKSCKKNLRILQS